jgi:hypothetical protein
MFTALRGTTTEEIQSSHLAIISHPDSVASIIRRRPR